MTLVLQRMAITCNHTPEIIDRILMQFRKRGLSVNSLKYEKTSDLTARCIVEFEESELNGERIFKNMQRTLDITAIERA